LTGGAPTAGAGEEWAVVEALLSAAEALPPDQNSRQRSTPLAAKQAETLRNARAGIFKRTDIKALTRVLAFASRRHALALRLEYARRYGETLGFTLRAEIPDRYLRDLFLSFIAPPPEGATTAAAVDAAAEALWTAGAGPLVRLLRESGASFGLYKIVFPPISKRYETNY